MKTIAKPIDMVSWTDKDGAIHPVKFRIEKDNGEFGVYKVAKIYTKELNKIAGNKMYKFNCLVNINNVQKICEIRYEFDTCTWNLFKI